MSDIQPLQGTEVGPLLDDLKTLIDQARQQVAIAVNAGLTLLYWQVGQRMRKDLLLEEERAAYGERIVATLSRQLTQSYGKGFTKSGLNRMVQFAEVFPDPQIVATLSQQLSWSHFLLLLPLGLILCAGKNREAVELLELEKSGIHVAEYLTALPPREVLERKLHEAVISARARLVQRPGDEESGV
ncbi:MAG: DUF1016 N-terminal domain-containing protein [Betaproteobacteria bacterium]|nr:DUF1016 N-terminal domain-containing protein [Betaproteobacteria bacterium]